jgi:uncharacterized protein
MIKPSQRLKQLYELIPSFECEPGCNDCCGPVAVIKVERKKLKLVESIIPTNKNSLTCCFSTPNGCSVYKDRPMTCRLFGTVEKLKCPKNKTPTKMLTDTEEKQIMNEYLNL